VTIASGQLDSECRNSSVICALLEKDIDIISHSIFGPTISTLGEIEQPHLRFLKARANYTPLTASDGVYN
jgi:hypothetical protein